MKHTAKVFSSGNSQAVRLPKAFRVDVSEMWISRNDLTGDITLRPRNDNEYRRKVLALMDLIARDPMPADFLDEASRADDPPRDPLGELLAPPVTGRGKRSRQGRRGGA